MTSKDCVCFLFFLPYEALQSLSCLQNLVKFRNLLLWHQSPGKFDPPNTSKKKAEIDDENYTMG